MSDKDLKTLWEDVCEWLTDATRSAIKEAEDLTRRGRLKMDIVNLSRQIERGLAELGGVVYEQVSAETNAPVVVDTRIKQLVEKLAKLQADRQARQKEYEAEKKKG
ncbi:MAG: hypothetical protein ABIL25_06520 [candidate division WOR-3 bacterium]